MHTDIFNINLFDWFAIWGAILVVLLVLMWFSREPRPRKESAESREAPRQGRYEDRRSHGHASG